jgi:uncharacterized protein (DUF1499 family)
MTQGECTAGAPAGHTPSGRGPARHAARLVGPIAWLVLVLSACGGTRPQDVGEVAGRLRACPDSPNCVSSDASDEEHGIAPIEILGPPEIAFDAARRIVSAWPRTEIVSDGPLMMHVECTSAIMRFVDDLELVLRPPRGEIAVRSASRVGYSDMGVNRRRVEKLREEMVREGVARPRRPRTARAASVVGSLRAATW